MTKASRALADHNDFRAPYLRLFGEVPAGIEQRIAIVERLQRESILNTIEVLRHEIIERSALGLKTQQLVHFGQLIVLGCREPALLHAGAAIRAGATLDEVLGVVETALVTSGMPAYGLGMSILATMGRPVEAAHDDEPAS